MDRLGPRTAKSPLLHTGIIDGIPEMWSKLRWDADVFRDIQVSYPSERQPLAYAAIGVYLAADSLRGWCWSVMLTRQLTSRSQEVSWTDELHRAVPQQAMCQAVANTFKHGNHRDGQWKGRVSMEWIDGDEDTPPGWQLFHHRPDGTHELAVNEFGDLCDNWWSYLRTAGLVDTEHPNMEWFRNKMTAIFG